MERKNIESRWWFYSQEPSPIPLKMEQISATLLHESQVPFLMLE